MALTKVTRTLLSTGIVDNSNATAITIDSSENVGIGTGSPTEKLTLNGALAITGALSDDRTSTGAIDFSSGVTRFVSYGASGTGGIFAFRTASGGASSTERMRIDGSGNVGIGTDSPSRQLTVQNSSDHAIIGAVSGTSNIAGMVMGDTSDDDTGAVLYNNSGNYMYFMTNTAERMRIDSSGNVNIGGTGLAYKLGIFVSNSGTAQNAFTSTNNANADYLIKHSTDLTTTGTSSGALAVNTAGSETMRMTSGNDVVIGHTAAVGTTHKGKLQVKSAISILDGSNTTAATLSLYSSGANSAFLSVDPDQEGNDTHFYFYIDGSNKMKLDNNGRLSIDPLETRTATGAINLLGTVGTSDSGGNAQAIAFRHNASGVIGTVTTTASATSYNTSSDYRLKENVDYTWDATTRLKQLKPARFNFIADETNTLVDGFLAHEVSSIVPEAITGAKDAVDSDGNPDYQGIDQSKLVPLLVKTIQELEARITTLEG